jgi:hypothetical protein
MFGWFRKKPGQPQPAADNYQATFDELRALQAVLDEAHRESIAEGCVVAPAETDRWVAAGESGYVNCLLTVLAEGTVRTATVAVGQLLPRLSDLAGDEPSSREWAERLQFPLESLSTATVLGILAKSFEMLTAGSGTLKTVLVRPDGAPLAMLFTARWSEPGVALAVTALPTQ